LLNAFTLAQTEDPQGSWNEDALSVAMGTEQLALTNIAALDPSQSLMSIANEIPSY